MELDASLSWVALALTPGLACRLCARLFRKIGSPELIFPASLTELESCSLPARAAQAIHNKDAFKRAEKELAGIRNIPGCRLLNWTEPEYPQTLLQIYDLPVLLYLRGDPQILNMPCLSIVGMGLWRQTVARSACWAPALTFVTRKKTRSSTKKFWSAAPS